MVRVTIEIIAPAELGEAINDVTDSPAGGGAIAVRGDGVTTTPLGVAIKNKSRPSPGMAIREQLLIRVTDTGVRPGQYAVEVWNPIPDAIDVDPGDGMTADEIGEAGTSGIGINLAELGGDGWAIDPDGDATVFPAELFRLVTQDGQTVPLFVFQSGGTGGESVGVYQGTVHMMTADNTSGWGFLEATPIP